MYVFCCKSRYLHHWLQRVDPASAERIHPSDQKRLVRALEVYHLTGRPLTAHTTPRLSGWPDTLDEAGCNERLGRELLSFATLCEQWPERWARAAASADERIAGA